MTKLSIAIDGPSGAGKSTLARCCAKAFGFIYVDTGAIYRTVGLAACRRGINCKDTDAMAQMLPELDIKMDYNAAGEQIMLLNGENVSAAIREPHISMAASDVSSLPVVREFLLDMQRKMAVEHDVIMDGRDIGTVVLPSAQLKIFLTASPEARAKRRLAELINKGKNVPFEEVLNDMKCRDEQDTNRAAAPLKAAEDAVLVDTSDINFEESFKLLCKLIEEKLAVEVIK